MPPSPDPSALQVFLEHPARPAGTLGYHELQGFLFTVVSAPEMVPPSQLKTSLAWPTVRRAQNRNKRLTLMMNARFSSSG